MCEAGPPSVAVTRDGALLVSDDKNGTIFRVTRGAGLGNTAVAQALSCTAPIPRVRTIAARP